MQQDFASRLDAVKTQVYSAALQSATWAVAIGAVRELVGADHAGFGLIDQMSRQALLHGDCSPEFERLYPTLSDSNPFATGLGLLRPGATVMDQQLLERQAFERSEFFNCWMRPQDQHSATAHKLLSRGGIGGYMMLLRGGRAQKFDTADIQRLAALHDTLSDALDLHMRFARGMLDHKGRLLESQNVGWMAVDAGGKMVWHNGVVETILAVPGSALTAYHGQIGLAQTQQSRRLLAAIQLAADDDPARRRGADMVATSLDPGQTLALSVVPARNLLIQGLPTLSGAYIGVQDLSQRLRPGFEERVRAMFELTAKEARLAAALASGQSLAACAEARHIALSTARSQLAQLFRKTGTTQQSQLVSLLLSIVLVPPML